MAETTIFSRIREQWALLLEVSVVVLGSIFVILLAPPRLSPVIETASWYRLAEFVGAILIVIGLVAIHRTPWSLRGLQWTTIIFVLGAIIAFFSYNGVVGAWTCSDYDGRGPIVIGSRLLPDAAALYPSPVSACTMVQDAAGNTASLWAQSELLTRHSLMAALFLLTALLFLVAAILAVELLAAHIRQSKEKPE